MTAPPPTRRDGVVDTLHGVEVPDPYRWLEAGDSAEVQQWVAAQNAHTREALDARPDRGWWHERLVALMQLPVVMAAQVRGDHLFCLERPAGAEQFVLTRRSAVDPDADPFVLVDPAAGTADAANAIDWFEASADGALVAVGTSEGGTEESVLRVLDAADGRDVGEAIPHTRACSVAWEPDGSGFAYTRYPEGDQYHRTVHHHRLGDALGGRSGAVGRAPRPAGVAGRHAVARRGVAARPRRASAGRASTSTCSTARPARGRRSSRASRPTSELVFAADGGVARRRDDARRAARPGRAAPRSTPRADRWETLVAEGDAVLSRLRVAGDELLAGRHHPRRRHRAPLRRATAARSAIVDGSRRRRRRVRPRRRPRDRAGVRRRRLVRRSRRRSGASWPATPAVRWSAPPTAVGRPCRR